MCLSMSCPSLNRLGSLVITRLLLTQPYTFYLLKPMTTSASAPKHINTTVVQYPKRTSPLAPAMIAPGHYLTDAGTVAPIKTRPEPAPVRKRGRK